MLIRTAAPQATAVTLAEAKANSRVTTAAEDALITAMVAAATDELEHHLSRAIMEQQWKLTLDSWGQAWRDAALVYTSAQQWRPASDALSGVIELRRPIVQRVDSVKYVDATTGMLTTLQPSEYLVDVGGHHLSRITPAYGKTWPAARAQINAVEILFTCGWAQPSDVPAGIKQWILQRVAAYYENREEWQANKLITVNPYAARLVARWKVPNL